MIVSESARERQEELQVNTIVIMDELRNPDDQGLGRAIRPVVDEKSWSARISFQETNLTHLGNIQLPEPRRATLYQSLPSFSLAVAVSSALTVFNNSHHNNLIINLVRIDTGYCMSMKVDGNESLCLV